MSNLTISVRNEGRYVVAVIRMPWRHGYLELRAAVDSREVERVLRSPEVGFINFRKLGRGISRAARGIARSSAVRSVLSSARDIASSPLVRAALPGPVSMALDAATQAVRTADRSRRDPRARQAIQRAESLARRGDPAARAAIRTVRLVIPAEIAQ